MEPGPVCRLGSRPRMLICYLCGREYGSKSLNIHIRQCQRMWLTEEEKKPKNERRVLPPQPNGERAIESGGARAFDSFNVEAYAAFEQTLEQCPYCHRRFLPKPFKTHQNGCTAAKPAKPAGTGLIKFSLTNRLVPGAVAGSLHGKAKKPPAPLRLCRPPPTLKPKLKSKQRPEWTGAGGSPLQEMEERQPVVKHKTSSQEWCLQADTNFSARRGTNPGQCSHKNQPGSRNSFQKRNGMIGSADKKWGGESGVDNANLVTTFGEVRRTHNKDTTVRIKPRNAQQNHKTATASRARLVSAAESRSSEAANPRTRLSAALSRPLDNPPTAAAHCKFLPRRASERARVAARPPQI